MEIENESWLKSNTAKLRLVQAFFFLILLLADMVDPMSVVFVYIFETIIIGFFNVVKLFFLCVYNQQKGGEYWIAFLMIPFFVLHFGCFVGVQTILMYTVFAIYDSNLSTSLSWENYQTILELEGSYLVSISLILLHLFTFYKTFLVPKKYIDQKASLYFSKPYIRIIIQQLLVIIPFCFFFFTDEIGKTAAILLVVMQSFLDYYFYKLANNPLLIKNLANKMLDKNKPEDLAKIEKSLLVFFEE